MPSCPPSCLSCHALRVGLSGDEGKAWIHNGEVADDGPDDPEGWIVDLHAGHSAPHDHLAGPGAFERTAALLTSLASKPVQVSTWIARPTFRNLGSIPPLLATLGVGEWRLRVVRSAPEKDWDRLTPRLALAMPRALHAADQARRLGIDVSIEGAPSCLLGPMASLGTQAEAGEFAPSCSECTLRPSCGGISAEYLERFGDEDLRPTKAK